jgi:N-acyl-D-aspartate/D-glutamate deacylase
LSFTRGGDSAKPVEIGLKFQFNLSAGGQRQPVDHRGEGLGALDPGGKGTLRAGAAADLVVVAPEEAMVVDPEALQHRNRVTPYAGARLTGVVRRTWLGGAPVTTGTGGRLLARGEA